MCENFAQKALIFKQDYIIIREVYGKNFLMQKAEGQSNGRDLKFYTKSNGKPIKSRLPAFGLHVVYMPDLMIEKIFLIFQKSADLFPRAVSVVQFQTKCFPTFFQDLIIVDKLIQCTVDLRAVVFP